MRNSLLIIAIICLPLLSLSQTTYISGTTTGNFPFLDYALGQDRLGSAKMGYLDTAITVFVKDSTADRYRIRLSQNHSAWMPKEFFKRDSILVQPKDVLSGSWRLSGNERYDFLKIRLGQRLPYQSYQELNPSRIVIDIYGAGSNTNWITQTDSAREVKNIYYRQVEDDVMRIFIDLEHEQHWGYQIYYEGNQLVVRIKQQPQQLQLNKMKIVIDAGHGGDNSGAQGIATRILEKDYTLKIAKELEKELTDAGATVYMTRTDDQSLTMNQRMDSAQVQEPDFLISIHLNSSSRADIRGTSTYYRHIGFRPLSQSILKEMVSIPLINFGNIGGFNFTLNGPTAFPNCLVEVAFLSNKEDEQLIRDPKFHRQVAEKITEGIRNWLKEARSSNK